MKAKQIFISGLIFLSLCHAWGQGTLTFVYDQQSATDTTPSEGGASNIQAAQPVGQSFTPSLSTVGFVQFSLNSSLPVSLYIDLRANSITGPILGQTEALDLPANPISFPIFLFSTPVSVTPGTTYYLQPILISGNTGIGGEFVTDYPGGTAFFQGNAVASPDLWFREGIVVPEPASWALLLVSGGALALGCQRRKIYSK